MRDTNNRWITISFSSTKELLRVAFPIIIEMSGLMLIQLIDAIFLSWHSAEAVASVITAGLVSWLCICIFSTTAGFTSTLVAHYLGANKEEKIVEIIINGIYFSIFSSLIIGVLGLSFVVPIFKWAGHEELVMKYEVLYFSILISGAFFPIANASISGYFYGTGNTYIIMVAQLIALGINSIFDYALILGKLGFPTLGVKGAAIATIIGEASAFIFIGIMFYFSIIEKTHRKKENKKSLFISFDPDIMSKIIRYGFPNGIRAFIDMLAWTIFPIFVGRAGTLELAASNIAYRINSITIFPILGLSTAVSILTGRAQGAKKPDLSVKIWKKGMVLGLFFTFLFAITYFLFPHKYYLMFYNNSSMHPSDFKIILKNGEIMLKMIALYSIFDTISIITLGFLQGAGDTRWTMISTILCYALFIAILFLIDFLKGGVKVLWITATIFIILQSIIWILRFFYGKWKEIELVNT